MNNRQAGNRGENIAAAYLLKKGFEILDRNYTFDRAEIDLICKKANLVVFVEVKLRKSDRYGYPEQAVNPRKQRQIAKAANEFMFVNKIEDEIRFDVISITLEPNGHRVYHIKDAFAPGMPY